MEYTPPPQPHSLPRTSQQFRQHGASKVGWPRLLAQYLPPSSDTSTLLNPPSSLQPPPSNSHPRLTPPFPTPGWAPPTSNPTPSSGPALPPESPSSASSLSLSTESSAFPLRPQLPTPPQFYNPSPLCTPSFPLSPQPLPSTFTPPPRAQSLSSPLLRSGTLCTPAPPPCLSNSLFRFSLVSDQVYVK